MNNFAVLDLAYTHYDTGIYICVKTDIPCHLTCYHTTKAPRRHRTSRIQRGLTLPWGVYFCFVAWQEVEQIEPGDTLYHLFNVSPWMVLSTKWFAFRGTINEELSPSVSAVFEHWHPGGLPMSVTLRVYFPGDLCDPRITGTGPDCPDHWQSVTTLPGYDPAWHLVGATINSRWGYDSYLVERGELGTIVSVTHWMKIKANVAHAFVRVVAHLLRINGTSYITQLSTGTVNWTYRSKIYSLNPDTGQAWTQSDLDTLQPGVGVRRSSAFSAGGTGYCDEVYIVVERGIICPP